MAQSRPWLRHQIDSRPGIDKTFFNFIGKYVGFFGNNNASGVFPFLNLLLLCWCKESDKKAQPIFVTTFVQRQGCGDSFLLTISSAKPDHFCFHFLCLCKESDKESTADFRYYVCSAAGVRR